MDLMGHGDLPEMGHANVCNVAQERDEALASLL